MTGSRGGGARLVLSRAERELRIIKILSTLIGDAKTTMQIARIVPYDAMTVRQVLRNLKANNHVATDPPVCSHKGWVVWMLTPLGLSRACGGNIL
ncbi:MAG: hypothetical protein LBV13_01260 [Methanomassiliicoccaceae archaeon]|jgi:DNA-binding CsgD family transcriptional regulator|nr:hypothetical protein [Methanomassiliicoccaceae archaeon]